MKLRFLIALTILTFSHTAQAQLSDKAVISVITCGAGNDFYTTFGHSAIRVCDTSLAYDCDTSLAYDVVYNYGSFDFNTPNFYWKFARGKLNYQLTKSHYQSFLYTYAYEGRYVWEQPLNLTLEEKNKIHNALEYNYKPENRYYLYDFFIDNCATRVRDIVNNNLIDRSLFTEHMPADAKSYRDLLYDCTEERLLWWRLGIDLLLGARCDKQCTNLEYMFSPLEMMAQFDTTQLSDGSGKLAQPHITTLYETRTLPNKSLSPTLLFWVVFMGVATLTILAWKKRWTLRWLDALLFGLAGIVSAMLLFMWFGTDHYCTKNNWNLLWASPLFAYFAIFARKSNRWIILVQIAMLLVVMASEWILPQQMNAAVLPIVLTLTLRLIDNLR